MKTKLWAIILLSVFLCAVSGEKTDIKKARIVTGREAALEAARAYLLEGCDTVQISTILWFDDMKKGDHEVKAFWYGKGGE
jgi:hypothetical protein